MIESQSFLRSSLSTFIVPDIRPAGKVGGPIKFDVRLPNQMVLFLILKKWYINTISIIFYFFKQEKDLSFTIAKKEKKTWQRDHHDGISIEIVGLDLHGVTL